MDDLIRYLDKESGLEIERQSCQPAHREKGATAGQGTGESLYCL